MTVKKSVFPAKAGIHQPGDGTAFLWILHFNNDTEENMTTKFLQLLILTASLCLGPSSMAADRASADEAVAMVRKAVAYIKANGKEKAIAEVNARKEKFIDRDLYITIGDANGVILASGGNPKLVGKSLKEIKDPDGKTFVMEMLNSKKQSGWVDFKWPNPVSQKIESKSMYFEKVDDLVVNCGVYKGDM
jgi:signal transduction histidine kinase